MLKVFSSLLLMIGLLLHFPATAQNRPFIVCDLHGQFGNQLFMIATALSMAKDHNAVALFPQANLLQGQIKLNYFTIFRSLNNRAPNRKISTYYHENSLSYQPIPYTPDMRIRGYFQCEDYFKHNREMILKTFAPSPSILAYLKQNYGDVIDDPKSVSIHVRTYNKETQRDLYVLNGRNYVEQAMAYFPLDSHFYVFSDDIKWCRRNLARLAPNMRFMADEPYLHDFYLQSLCKHHIISNSSFSWWAAWLNRNPDKIVVAPKNWFTDKFKRDSSDIVPKSWIQIDTQDAR